MKVFLVAATLLISISVANHDVPTREFLTGQEYYVRKCEKSSECKYLTQALYHESRGEIDEGVIAVGYVILNRVKHPTMWPKTIAGVISQKFQFSYRHDGSLKKGFTDREQYVRVAIIAARVLEGSVGNPVGDATFYHNSTVKPYWTKKKKFVVKIGSHSFYK